jgi:hypothetical protein
LASDAAAAAMAAGMCRPAWRRAAMVAHHQASSRCFATAGKLLTYRRVTSLGVPPWKATTYRSGCRAAAAPSSRSAQSTQPLTRSTATQRPAVLLPQYTSAQVRGVQRPAADQEYPLTSVDWSIFDQTAALLCPSPEEEPAHPVAAAAGKGDPFRGGALLLVPKGGLPLLPLLLLGPAPRRMPAPAAATAPRAAASAAVAANAISSSRSNSSSPLSARLLPAWPAPPPLAPPQSPSPSAAATAGGLPASLSAAPVVVVFLRFLPPFAEAAAAGVLPWDEPPPIPPPPASSAAASAASLQRRCRLADSPSCFLAAAAAAGAVAERGRERGGGRLPAESAPLPGFMGSTSRFLGRQRQGVGW